MDDTRVSRYMSLLLRHSPEKAGLTVETGGWVDVDALLKALRVTREDLERIVARDEKGRYSFNAAGDRIRANQGHSFPVDLQLAPLEPPEVLFHGTATRNLDAILETGIQRMSRQYIHLSLIREVATNVGARHGKPVVLRIEAGRMHRAGFAFYRSENGIWLTESVPPEFISIDAGE